MKAHKLARILLGGPDLAVFHVWDGVARTQIEFVWVAPGEFEYRLVLLPKEEETE